MSSSLLDAHLLLRSGLCVGRCALPWNLKIFVAFLSDCVPIRGRRRSPYLFIGLALQIVALLMLGLPAEPTLALVFAANALSTAFHRWTSTSPTPPTSPASKVSSARARVRSSLSFLWPMLAAECFCIEMH